MADLIGKMLGSYKIVEQIGEGGMATVYKAYHPDLDRHVALKVILPEFSSDRNFLIRFRREAQVVAKLDHPNIVPVYDFSEQRGSAYLVMKLIPGESLSQRMSRGPLALPETLRILAAVGGALEYAHRQGVMHRDIKPSNILLEPNGGIYLSDFGLARMIESGESTISSEMTLGTPHYISPEQAQSARDLDKRCDIYSLGIVMYEIVVGRLPFPGDNPYSVLYDQIHTPVPLPRTVNPSVPEGLERTLVKALAKDRNHRYKEVSAFVREFEIAAAINPETIPLPRVEIPMPAGAFPPPGNASPAREKAPEDESASPPPPDRPSGGTGVESGDELPETMPGDQSNSKQIPAASLVHADGTIFPLRAPRVSIGRTGRQDIDLSRWDAEKFVSKEHAEITLREGRWLLTVLTRTRNPTRVNGGKILPGEEKTLTDGDEIQFAKVRLAFRSGARNE